MDTIFDGKHGWRLGRRAGFMSRRLRLAADPHVMRAVRIRRDGGRFNRCPRFAEEMGVAFQRDFGTPRRTLLQVMPLHGRYSPRFTQKVAVSPRSRKRPARRCPLADRPCRSLPGGG